ncbi:hypothetical protein [Bacillus yapensis]|uniref:hypothetical protein n=1 Tax=Bacillus yapensis TaxID=2492960 RepID=UPI001BB0701A|nr:hypothetical protein [Bacillus yapensis]
MKINNKGSFRIICLFSFEKNLLLWKLSWYRNYLSDLKKQYESSEKCRAKFMCATEPPKGWQRPLGGVNVGLWTFTKKKTTIITKTAIIKEAE